MSADLWATLISWWAPLIKALRWRWRSGHDLPDQGLPSQARSCQALRRNQPSTALICLCLLIGCCCLAAPLAAAPGLCLGPVCGDEFSRNPQFPWQLRLRVSDQSGRHERLVVDCRDGVISPRQGPVERGYAAAVARRACRLASNSPSQAEPARLSSPEVASMPEMAPA